MIISILPVIVQIFNKNNLSILLIHILFDSPALITYNDLEDYDFNKKVTV